MTHAISLRAALLGATLLAIPLLPGAAQAQMTRRGINDGGMVTGPVVGTQTPATRRQAPPPALPGARNEAGPAPMDRLPGDMNPNEALFDAINRGDIAAARDALGRGADLHATNVLGMTPTELSVDLGRNDITFLLLSMRGAAGGEDGRRLAANGATPDAETGAAPGATPAGPAAAPRHRAVARVAARPAAPPAPAPRPAPRQYADNPGTPVPRAGFLGFGPGIR